MVYGRFPTILPQIPTLLPLGLVVEGLHADLGLSSGHQLLHDANLVGGKGERRLGEVAVWRLGDG